MDKVRQGWKSVSEFVKIENGWDCHANYSRNDRLLVGNDFLERRLPDTRLHKILII